MLFYYFCIAMVSLKVQNGLLKVLYSKHGDIIYGETIVGNDDGPDTINLLIFIFSGGSLYTNQRRQRRRPHKLLFQLSFASSGGEKYNK